MKYYLFKNYITNTEALFSTRYKVDEFANRFKHTIETETGFEVDDNEYAIRELELNPNFEKWYYSS